MEESESEGGPDVVALAATFEDLSLGALLEVLPHSFALLGVTDLASCRAASRSWSRAATSSPQVVKRWQDAVESSFPSMAASVTKDKTPEQVDWCRLFLARCGKRAKWSAEREATKAKKVERVFRLQADAAGKGEVSQKAAIGPQGRNKRTRCVREKTCRRCGTRFVPAAAGVVEAAACHFHSGTYLQVDEHGVALPDNGEGAALMSQVREQLRKRGPKKRGHLELSAPQRELHFRWSCCDARVLTAPGCTQAAHC